VLLLLADGGVVAAQPTQKAWLRPDALGPLELPRASLGGGWLGAPPSPEATQSLEALGAVSRLVPSLAPEPPSAAVLKQAGRVEWVEAQLQELPLHAEPRRDDVLAAYTAREELQLERGRILKRRARDAKAEKKRKQRDEQGGGDVDADEMFLRKLLGERGGPTAAAGPDGAWGQFLAVGEVLRQYGALDEWEATQLGELVSELAGDNELWLVMIEVAESDLLPHQLAAVLASTLDERVRPNVYVAYTTSEAVFECLEVLGDRADALDEAQLRRGLSFSVPLDGGICGLVEAWAQGEEWTQLMANTSLDPGDVFRVLRRTVELLRQVSLVPYVSDAIQRRAVLALRAMDRYPLADNALMSLESAEGAEAEGPEAEAEEEPEAL